MKLLLAICVLLIGSVAFSYGGSGRLENTDTLQVAGGGLRVDSIADAERTWEFSGNETDSIRQNEATEKKQGGLISTVMKTVAASPRDSLAERLAAEQEQQYFERFAGRTVGEITIIRKNVFEDGKSWLERAGNRVHITTREWVIRKDLLFGSGDKVDAQLIIRNKQLIRSRNYIADVRFVVIPLPSDTTTVDIYVITRDTWTISLDMRVRGDGRTYIELFDDDLLGLGHSFGVRTYFNWKTFDYGGNLFRYSVPNLLGTFLDMHLVAGKGFDNSDFGGEVNKDFILPEDFAGGVSAFYIKEPIELFPLDSTVSAKYQTGDIWGGKSFYMKGLHNSLYFTGRFLHQRFIRRPEVTAELNPFFHNQNMILANVGLYRERLRLANLIFGYGVEEFIAYGYRFGITMGYLWGEFGHRGYLGGEVSAGAFFNFGYLGGQFEIGSYINQSNGKFYRSALKSHINFFSNLMGNGAYRVRQFVNLYAVKGWNRVEGYRERVAFRNNGDLRGLVDRVNGRHGDRISGLNSLVLNSETVVFTPWNVANFRFAMFGYNDLGLIGDNGNMFRNDFYTTFGVGVRIKNERLIFSTINIRLAVAVSKKGFIDSHYIGVSTADRLNEIRYRPNKATVLDYK